jgi:hypothetical protein
MVISFSDNNAGAAAFDLLSSHFAHRTGHRFTIEGIEGINLGANNYLTPYDEVLMASFAHGILNLYIHAKRDLGTDEVDRAREESRRVKMIVYANTKGFGSLPADYELAKLVIRIINAASGPGH